MARADIIPLTAGMQLRLTFGRFTKSIMGKVNSGIVPAGGIEITDFIQGAEIRNLQNACLVRQRLLHRYLIFAIVS